MGHHGGVNAPTTARARVRAELTREIKDAARRQLAEQGTSGLSLRAVARELGMVSSAIYRYFPSRDDLLTALIIDAYDDVGAAAEAGDAACRRDDYGGRWVAATKAVRAWARANPHEYALIYGSPVPGYAAPEDTIGPATRVTAVMTTVLADAVAADALVEPTGLPPAPRAVQRDVARLRELVPSVPPEIMTRGLIAWTQVFGAVSFELFGHLHNVVEEHEAFFDHAMAVMAAYVGLPSKGLRSRR